MIYRTKAEAPKERTLINIQIKFKTHSIIAIFILSSAWSAHGANRRIEHHREGRYEIWAAPTIITSDASGTHTTTPGVPAFGVNHDGVGDMLIDNDSDDFFDIRCSGSLLQIGGRQWAVTAAHCVTDSLANKDVQSLRMEFHTASGSKFSFVSDPSQVHVHPNWGGNTLNGFDVALIRFDEPADASVPAYLLNRTAEELDVNVVCVGYGNKGFGQTGDVFGTSGTKRAGLQKWEERGVGNRGVVGVTNNSTMLTGDFDSNFRNTGGTETDDYPHDGFNYFFDDPHDLGFGDDEAGLSPGDSGGASFVLDPQDDTWKIAGTHSHALRLLFIPGEDSSDIDDELNFSWGEFNVDARIRDADVLNWIDSTIPEPATVMLLALGGAAIMRRRNRT